MSVVNKMKGDIDFANSCQPSSIQQYSLIGFHATELLQWPCAKASASSVEDDDDDDDDDD